MSTGTAGRGRRNVAFEHIAALGEQAQDAAVAATTAGPSEGDTLAQLTVAESAMTNRPRGLLVPASFTDETDAPEMVVPLSELADNPYGSRIIYPPEKLTAFAQQLKANGQIVPGIAAHLPDGQGLAIVDGKRRRMALELAGIKTMKVVVNPRIRTVQDFYEFGFKVNEQREPHTSLDNALAWRALLDDKVSASYQALAALTGYSMAQISKTLAILELGDELIALISEAPDRFGISVGYELFLLAKAAPPEVMLDLVKRMLTEDVSRTKIEALRKQIEDGKSRKPKAQSRAYQIRQKDQGSGVLKEWDDGRVRLELTVKDPAARDELLALFKQRFAIEAAGSNSDSPPVRSA